MIVETSRVGDFAGTYIYFRFFSHSESGRTAMWRVLTKDDGLLGEIRWFARWRKYSFYPADDCVFEQVCLREIAAFIEDQTKAHRK